MSPISPIFEPTPRWPDAPPICIATNMPAFTTEQAAKDWLDAPKKGNPIYESNSLKKLWKCDHCQHWHMLTKTRPPSGHSSGSSRR